MRKAITALLALLLAALSNGTLMLACPQKQAPQCHRQERTHPHCPFSTRVEQCPLLNDDLAPGEHVAKVAVAPATSTVALAEATKVPFLSAADWQHSQDLHIRIRVLRI